MSVTIEEAAKRYVAARESWQAAKDAHKRLIETTLCENEESEKERAAYLDSKEIEYQWMPKRCFDCPPEKPEYDNEGRTTFYGGMSYCEACELTYAEHLKVVTAARKKGAAHRVLTQTVKRVDRQ